MGSLYAAHLVVEEITCQHLLEKLMPTKPPTRDQALTELQLQTERWLTTASLEQIRDRLRQLHEPQVDDLPSLECGTFDSDGAVRSCSRCDDVILALETVANTARPELMALYDERSNASG